MHLLMTNLLMHQPGEDIIDTVIEKFSKFHEGFMR